MSIAALGTTVGCGDGSSIKAATEGLEYLLSKDGTYYTVKDYTGESTAVYVSNTYKELPVKGIDWNAFYDCASLTEIAVCEGVSFIGREAFWGCSSLTKVELPDSVTSISDYAFAKCDSLTEIVIPEGVTSIGAEIFDDCDHLTSITFESTATWYVTDSAKDWQNQTGGTEIDVTDIAANVAYFTDEYDDYYWYKK